ncbi:helix-turn-helix domain-containing protein [Kitasatospora misakiensis]|uniref:Helix-turn-helix domain-containing protein n=1 Tax=Kitasatospora misakiensis TaxID=67330 RepID=A0ABW0WXR7_9ACTN
MPRAAGLSPEITHVDLGPVRLSSLAYPPVRGRRTGDPERYRLALVADGVVRAARAGGESPVAADLVLTYTSRGCADGPARAVVLRIPRSALPLPADEVDHLLARRIPAREGTGAVLARFLGALLDQGPLCRPEELSRLGSVTLDLAAACLAQRPGAPEEAPAEARDRLLLRRVHRFIEHNLDDPALTPQAIADHHHMSLRALYLLFRDQPASVAATVRRKRLERCRAELAAPEPDARPVRTIAARWGFSSATAFGRAFREAYGMTPTEYRARARRGPVGERPETAPREHRPGSGR